MRKWIVLCGVLAGFGSVWAQVTPAAGTTPPDDTPSFKIGTTIFTDYTYTKEPTTTDAAAPFESAATGSRGRIAPLTQVSGSMDGADGPEPAACRSPSIGSASHGSDESL